MSDHLIAEANRHAMGLPTTHPTHADIAWYVREVGELRAEVERLKRDYDYDHKCLHEVRERCELWKQRAERAEAEVERLRHLEALLNQAAAEVTAHTFTAGGIAGLRAENERLRRAYVRPDDIRAQLESAAARVARAEAEVNRLKSDGAASAFVDMSCRASRAETELATERARLDWLLSRMSGNVLPVNQCVAWTVDVYHYGNRFPSRAAIDAAMKEETK